MIAARATLLRPVLLYLAVTALVAVAAWAAMGSVARAPAQAAPPAQPMRAPQPALLSHADAVDPLGPTTRVWVTGVHGTVERAGAGTSRWAPVSDGAELGVDDSLRTAQGASADLQVGDRSRIGIAERSEMTVREISRSLHRFKLERGRVSAHYGSDGARVLRIEGEDGSVVETRQGDVGVMDTGTALAVAAQSGSATLTAAGQTVEIDAGRQAVVQRDSLPGAAEPIPVQVLLRLADAERPLPGDRTALVKGATSPGARVWVNGTPAAVDGTGRFSAHIPVHQGTNRVVARVEDVLGRSARRVLPPIVIERSGQVDDLSIRWGRATGSTL